MNRAVLGIAIACALIAVDAVADEPSASELATARALFDEGLALEDQGDWPAALVRFQKVAAVRTTPQVRFHLGLCLKNLRRLVEALNEFRRALSEATADASASAQIVIENAGKHVADLEARIPRLRIAAADGVTVRLDGKSISASLIGTPILVDPGAHVVTAASTGKKPFEKKVDVAEKSGTTEVTVALEDTTQSPSPSEPSTPKPAESRTSPWPWITGGAAVASFAAATTFYLLRTSTMSELDPLCNPSRNGCPGDKRDVAARGRTYTTLGNVFLGVGAVAASVSIVLFAVRSAEPRTASLAITGDASSVGLWLLGRF